MASSGNGFDEQISQALDAMRTHGVQFEHGLSDAEVEAAERRFDVLFPPDLRALLQAALPVRINSPWGADAFPNWRTGTQETIQRQLDWPFEGIAFDIEHNVFWLTEWGPKPDNLPDTLAIARRAVSAAPRLIPVCGHRYLPSDPPIAGNPVFSVYQTDIIYYGCDLWDYFDNEFAPHDKRWKRFQGQSEAETASAFRNIRFWSAFTE
jgi:hypothetical protein